MSRTIPFQKLHGLGNDFLVVQGRGLPKSLGALARALCARHTGVGADGVAVLLAPRNRKHDARVRFFNADGSEAEMSGNGIRCAGAVLAAGRALRRPLELETLAGLKTVQVVKRQGRRWVFRVSMGRPIFEPARIPFKAGNHPTPITAYPLRTRRGLLPVTVTSIGNPHCTVLVADFVAIDWASLGREIETNPLFPHRTNVEFVKVRSKREIGVRFWERGVGETMSSGTGSCAAAVACILNGLTARRVRVRTPAGTLEVEWPENGEVSLTGPAETIAEGTYHYPQ